jgi:hypothetical protein
MIGAASPRLSWGQSLSKPTNPTHYTTQDPEAVLQEMLIAPIRHTPGGQATRHKLKSFRPEAAHLPPQWRNLLFSLSRQCA